MKGLKYQRNLYLVVVLLVSILLTACSSEKETGTQTGDSQNNENGESETFELTFSSYLGENSPPNPVVVWFIEEVEKRTEARVKIEPFWAGSLLGGPDTLTGLKDGRADMAYVNPAAFPSELPLTNVVAVPFVNANPEVTLKTFYDLYQNNETYKTEWENQGIRVLNFFPFGTNVIGTQDQVDSIDWFDGKMVRGLGYVNQALEAVGANPIAIDAAEVYEALNRKTIEAVSGMTLEAYSTLKFQEVAPHIVDTGLGSYITATMSIRKEVWDKMPSDIQQIVSEVALEAQEKSLESLNEWQENSAKQIVDAGGTIKVLPEDEVQKWKDAIGDTIINQWIEENEERGLPAKDFFDQYTELIKKYQESSTYTSGAERWSTE
ncbi:C4-dicarboxylate TRAP transporter substrate-binding protein [Bacillus sp. 1P02SD]|uniref:C4-dicarboxylate TRAP transporter substrate-binding protein n=1 Tax=Bacillus sp. 1P02SD TaxID=3132264 RepID=UPI0039A22D46